MKGWRLFGTAIMLCLLTACGNERPQAGRPETNMQEQTQPETSNTESDETGEQKDGNAAEVSEVTEGDTQISEEDTDVEASEPEEGDAQMSEANVEGSSMKITVGDTTFMATLSDNSSVDALRELLMEGPLTISMSDYGNMEKVGPIGTSLPENNEQITTGAGDIILYQGNSLVIYYDTNSWNFTWLGRIEDATQEELKEALGNGDVTVTLSLE